MLILLIPAAFANERRFTYTYDTQVLPVGVREVEPWTTFKPEGDGLVLDQRVELEFAVTNRLMSAFYLNHIGGESSVSSEWKWNVASRATAPIGLALYGEVGVGPEETEIEGKVLVDKEAGALLVAANLVAEVELGEEEVVAEANVGAAVRVGKGGSIGVEGVAEGEVEELDETEIGVGPALAYATKDWWAAATGLAIVAPEIEPEVRVMLGFNF